MFDWWRKLQNALSEQEVEVKRTSREMFELRAKARNLLSQITDLNAELKDTVDDNRSERERIEFQFKNRLRRLEQRLSLKKED